MPSVQGDSSTTSPRPSVHGTGAPSLHSVGSGYQISIDPDRREVTGSAKTRNSFEQHHESPAQSFVGKLEHVPFVVNGQPSYDRTYPILPRIAQSNRVTQNTDGSYNSRLLQYVDGLRDESNTPIEPGFIEASTLRNINLIDLNNRLAKFQTLFIQQQAASEEDLIELRKLLHDQADAIRDIEYMRSLDYLTTVKKRRRQDLSYATFPEYGDRKSGFDSFESRAYRTLRHNESSLPAHDSVRSILTTLLPVSLTWSNDEKLLKPDLFKQKYQPTVISGTVERIARFVIAMIGALFILVPMYIMAIHQSQTKNLVTTTVAVILFAVSTSVALRMSNDQTLGATFAYAAVLMVFVGLTTQNKNQFQ